uniref:X8 domain-containing protein n=1 Tax=Steinernema glaseri TaxID=37863 RepID=A0A1I7Y956_9BILA
MLGRSGKHSSRFRVDFGGNPVVLGILKILHKITNFYIIYNLWCGNGYNRCPKVVSRMYDKCKGDQYMRMDMKQECTHSPAT